MTRAGGVAQRGFSYLAVLFLVAITAAALAALGEAWSTGAQRERERELAFRGGEIARALQSYQASPSAPGQFPVGLEDLLEDRRGPVPRRHLRRLYADPFTGQPDWVLVPEPSQPGRFSAVRSRSTRPLLRVTAPDGTPTPTAADWVFAARAGAGGPPVAALPANAASMAAPASAAVP